MRPEFDDGPEALGALLIYAVCLVAAIAAVVVLL